MAENETVKTESAPKYRKSAQWFAIMVVALLALVLMIDTFRRAGRDAKEAKPLPIDQQRETRQSELDFQRRLDQEIKRRQLQKAMPADKQKARLAEKGRPEQQMKLQQSQAALETQQVSEPNVFAEWKKNEKRRALEARQAGFAIKAPSGSMRKVKRVSHQTEPTVKNANLVLGQEQQRVMAEIERLKGLQKGRAVATQQAPLGFKEGFQTVAESQEDTLTIGRPRSESMPQAGQKLIPTGTIIGAVLDQELMSDYVGPFRGLVTHDVYDVSDNYILMPKGSRIIGRSLRITNVNEAIQSRMALVVRWLVLPNGKRISFEKRVAALDQAGVPAIKDKVNYHFFSQFLGVAAYALLASSTSYEGSGWSEDRTFEGNFSESLRQQFAPLAAKYINLVPTITLRKGTPLKIFIEDDIYAFPWDSISQRLFRVNRASY